MVEIGVEEDALIAHEHDLAFARVDASTLLDPVAGAVGEVARQELQPARIPFPHADENQHQHQREGAGL